jgi:uncharacterized membrane protein (DUF373 family)
MQPLKLFVKGNGLGKFRNILAGILSWLIILGLFISPWLAMIAATLTTIKWYTVSASVLQGVFGFLVGGTVTLLGLGVVLALLGAMVYFVTPEKSYFDIKKMKGE